MGPEFERFVEDGVRLGEGGDLVHYQGGCYVSYELHTIFSKFEERFSIGTYRNDYPVNVLDRVGRNGALYNATPSIARQSRPPSTRPEVKLEFVRDVAIVWVVPSLRENGRGRSGSTRSR